LITIGFISSFLPSLDFAFQSRASFPPAVALYRSSIFRFASFYARFLVFALSLHFHFVDVCAFPSITTAFDASSSSPDTFRFPFFISD